VAECVFCVLIEILAINEAHCIKCFFATICHF
jgi:hypothetical protein